jgi:hypothetical protein
VREVTDRLIAEVDPGDLAAAVRELAGITDAEVAARLSPQVPSCIDVHRTRLGTVQIQSRTLQLYS